MANNTRNDVNAGAVGNSGYEHSECSCNVSNSKAALTGDPLQSNRVKLHACYAGECGGEEEGGVSSKARERREGGEGRKGRAGEVRCREEKGGGGEPDEREVEKNGCQVAYTNHAALKGWVYL